MATSVTLPALGESVTEGTVTRWLKQPGDQVAVDEPLLEVSTDKVDTEIPSPVAGTLLEIKVDEDETVEVGAELCTIGDEGESGGSDDGADELADADSDDGGRGLDDERRAVRRASPRPQLGDGARRRRGRDRKTETETDPPAAQTDDAAPAQETPPSSADTKPEADASEAAGSGRRRGTPVTLPALGESVTEGTVTRWLKQVGDEVAVDEPLLEVSTDKVDTEIPSPVAGTLLEIKVDEDETVEVGAELAVIGSGDAAASAAPATPRRAPAAEDKEPEPEPEPEQEPEPEPEAKQEPEPKQEPDPQQEPSPGQQERPRASSAPERRGRGAGSARVRGDSDGGAYVTPLVRKMAAEHGVDLSDPHRHRRRWPDPQAGRPRRRRRRQGGSREPAAAPAAAGRRSRRAGDARRRPPSPLRGKTEPMTPAAQGDRQADGRVAAGLGPAHHGGRGRRHLDRPAARLGEGRLRRPRGREAVVPAVLRQGGDRRAQGAPVAQRRDRHREGRGHLLRPREPRRSRSTPRRAC